MERKKVCIIATLQNFIAGFEKNNIKILQEMGYDVIAAANFSGDVGKLDQMGVEKWDIPFTRSPFSLDNIKAIRLLNKKLKDTRVELIHCHTPVGGVAGRLVGKLNKIPVIYTAHGFHFFKGAPIKNWILYYPVEKFLSRWTNILITINKEDFERASHFYSKKVEYVPGVGVDIQKIKASSDKKTEKRNELGVSDKTRMFLSVGELNLNKNHEVVIKAFGTLKDEDFKYFICGEGGLKNYLQELIKSLQLEDRVFCLGYRNDIYELCHASDVFIFPSKREGLSVALMEAIVSDTPAICSKIRGNTDVVVEGVNGTFVTENISKSYEEKIRICLKGEMSIDLETSQKEIQKFDLKNVEKMMKEIYKQI